MANQGPASGRSLTVRQVTFLFFLGVIVCAVFFAFGYVLGRNPGAPGQAQSVEQVPPHSEVPPTVNPSTPEPSANAPESASGMASSGVTEQDLKGAANPAPPPVASGQGSTATQNPAQTIQPSSRSSEASPVPARSPALQGIMVQVAASRSEEHARSLVHKLRERGFRAVLIAPRGSKIYRVQVGPFTSRREAMRAVKRLTREGFRPFVR
jgi:DedD protein